MMSVEEGQDGEEPCRDTSEVARPANEGPGGLRRTWLGALTFAVGIWAGFSAGCHAPPAALPEDPPEVVIGERLFLEPRFSQYGFTHLQSGVNQPWREGDKVVDALETLGDPRPSPFAGQAMSCRACHLVDDAATTDRLAVRAYNDFARLSPIPDRGDGHTHTPRNSPTLVGTSPGADGAPRFLHFDGQFPTPEDLVRGTYLGRNFGWLPEEAPQALAHVARVIREDDGQDALGRGTWSLSYATLLAGTSPEIPPGFVLPPAFRLDVQTASDDQVMEAVSRLVGAYLRQLQFAKDAGGDYIGSPYDRFLVLNELPRHPEVGETPLAYARRLRAGVEALTAPRFVDEPTRLTFTHHEHAFRFGPQELAGLAVFLAEPGSTGDAEATGGVGGCVQCHTPPDFTDHAFHNTGISQEGYDAVFGAGAFAALDVPTLAVRDANPAAYLPASGSFTAGAAPFLALPSADKPGYANLGLWNVFGHPGLRGAAPEAQARLGDLIAAAAHRNGGAADELLPLSVGLFKTPTVRDLGQSPPYFHDGSRDTLAEALQHYRNAAAAARAGTLRNGAAELAGIRLSVADLEALVAFLEALDEDYE